MDTRNWSDGRRTAILFLDGMRMPEKTAIIIYGAGEGNKRKRETTGFQDSRVMMVMQRKAAIP